MTDSITMIREEIKDIHLGEIISPAEDALLRICDRLALRIEALERKVTRKIVALDAATSNARARTVRF